MEIRERMNREIIIHVIQTRFVDQEYIARVISALKYKKKVVVVGLPMRQPFCRDENDVEINKYFTVRPSTMTKPIPHRKH